MQEAPGTQSPHGYLRRDRKMPTVHYALSTCCLGSSKIFKSYAIYRDVHVLSRAANSNQTWNDNAGQCAEAHPGLAVHERVHGLHILFPLRDATSLITASFGLPYNILYNWNLTCLSANTLLSANTQAVCPPLFRAACGGYCSMGEQAVEL